MTALLWLRRDLRRGDLPALSAAAGFGDVVVCFVLDDRLWAGAGVARRTWLAATVQQTNHRYDGRLVLRRGRPEVAVPQLAAEVGAEAVCVSAETTPFGRRRDAAVAERLAAVDVAWVPTGSPYAVGPGRILTRSGRPYQVFTPFAAAWRDHGWPGPADEPAGLRLGRADSDETGWQELAAAVAGRDVGLAAGETAALARWAEFREQHLSCYHQTRDRPDLDQTSRLSGYLKTGAIHPRTLLADIADQTGPGPDRFRTELAWREFYADVVWHHPASAWHDLRPTLAALPYDEAADRVTAWTAGRTGYPIVDAGMRQLLAEGWMHNRVRMITASFLTKDLHVWWPVGARHFLTHLIDGDLASNSHGWQWVAGTGTDASPYFRIFNPVTQGRRFDPDGDYLRRWLPELAHLPGAAAHEPWRHPLGYHQGYPRRVVDHAAERRDSLARYQIARRVAGEGAGR